MKPQGGARRIVALDTETTGFSPDHHRVVEIGAVEVDPRTGVMGPQLHELLNPLQPIPWAATKVHGLRDGDVRDKPHFGVIAPAIIDFVRGSTLAIHNSRFDVQMLDAELLRHGFPKLESFDVEVVDTLVLARELLPFLPSHKLDNVCDALRVDRSTRSKHGALLDAQLVGHALPRLAREFDSALRRPEHCGATEDTAAEALAALGDEEIAKIDGRTFTSLESSFCRVARVLTFIRHCRLALLGRWETEIAFEEWSCAHFVSSRKTSSSLSSAAAAKALLPAEALVPYRKAPSMSRTVTARTEYVLDDRFEALAQRLNRERYDAHQLSHAVLVLESAAARLNAARDDVRALILEAASGKELVHVVITAQERTAVDYTRALRELAPNADLAPFRAQSTPLRTFRARDLSVCTKLFGPPLRRESAA